MRFILLTPASSAHRIFSLTSGPSPGSWGAVVEVAVVLVVLVVVLVVEVLVVVVVQCCYCRIVKC